MHDLTLLLGAYIYYIQEFGQCSLNKLDHVTIYPSAHAYKHERIV